MRWTPRAAMGVLVGATLAFALTRRGHSAESVDVRTYIEMIRGVAAHGLPYLDNGPIDDFAALRVPWNIAVAGRYWAVYSPAYAYFAAPFFMVGGLPLVSSATFALLAPIAWLTFLIARRLVKNEWYAFAAALFTLVATPLPAKALQITAFPLTVFFAVAATHTALRAVDEPGGKRLVFAAVTGVLGACGASTHLLCVPMVAGLFGALAVAGATTTSGPAPSFIAGTALAWLRPSRRSFALAGAALSAFGLALVPLASLNAKRFGSWNPFSYGPTPWRGSDVIGVAQMTMSAHLRHAAPVLALVGMVTIAWILAVKTRRPGLVRAAVLVVAAAVVAASPLLRDRCWRHLQLASAFVLDAALVPSEIDYSRAPHTFGLLLGTTVLKGTLECTPLLVFVFLARRLDATVRQRLVVVLAPCLALYTYLALRANLPLFSALGYPTIYIRYTLPALPLLVVAAMPAVEQTGPRRRDWLAGGALTVTVAALLQIFHDDDRLPRQLLILALPLALAGVAAVLVVVNRWRPSTKGAAATAATLVCGLSVAIAYGHDFRWESSAKSAADERVDAVRLLTPARCALFGRLADIDGPLALRAERDVQYADLLQLDDWRLIRPLLEHWFDEDRPVFFLAQEKTEVSFWPDVRYELVDGKQRIFRVTRAR